MLRGLRIYCSGRARRPQLPADRNLEAGIDFPVRQRPDAAKYSVSMTRWKIVVTRVRWRMARLSRKLILPDARYEQALEEALRNTATRWRAPRR
jgi:hypothetical protein